MIDRRGGHFPTKNAVSSTKNNTECRYAGNSIVFTAIYSGYIMVVIRGRQSRGVYTLRREYKTFPTWESDSSFPQDQCAADPSRLRSTGNELAFPGPIDTPWSKTRRRPGNLL